MIKKTFQIPLTDEPYVGTTALNKTYTATYTGPRYLLVKVDQSTGVVENTVFGTDSLVEMDKFTSYPKEPGKLYEKIDATVHTFEAAYISGYYDTGKVEDYSEDIGTVDEDGKPETFTYGWDDNNGMIGQQYLHIDMKFKNGAWIRPGFRVHILSRESFLASLVVQINAIEKAFVEKADLISAEDKIKLQEYVAWLKAVPTKYANVKHWKIPFKHQVPVY